MIPTPTPPGLADRLRHMDDTRRLAIVGQAATFILAGLGEFPCRLDEMTDREAAIAGIACTLTGALQFIGEIATATSPDPSPLERELATYKAMLYHLLTTLNAEGQYVVIMGTTCHGIERTYEEALRLGYRTCGLAPFLVKQVRAEEPVLMMRPG